MQLPENQNVDTVHLQRLFDNKSESYKLFWFQAILEKVNEGKTHLSYDEIINYMIANAWYMVSEYRLDLGPSDTLEELVKEAFDNPDNQLKSSSKKNEIIDSISSSSDKALKKKKQTLALNVPYRLQAPFLSDFKGEMWNGSKVTLAERINSQEELIYRFDKIDGLNSSINVEEKWAEYFRANYGILQGWVEYNLIAYLQRRNPSVPGIPNKIYPPQSRNLDKVKKYWKAVIDVSNVKDIYLQKNMDKESISIDHFIPWSYVAHDELWNLSPTTRSVNSSKSNNLPDWDIYFPRLAKLEYEANKAVWKYDGLHKIFDDCAKEHVNSEDAKNKLYIKDIKEKAFYDGLEEILLPSYMAAKNLGFRDGWCF